MINILFICSRNQWRSPTAEQIWRQEKGLSVRSAGISNSAKRKVSEKDIDWADLIFVMEQTHKKRLRSLCNQKTLNKPIFVLDIPDEYPYMDQELITLLRQAVDPVLAQYR